MKPKKIAIITDSTCDIPQALVERYDIKITPQIIIWGNEQFRDRVDLTPEEFYRRLKTDPQRPTSSQASAADFQHLYEEAASQCIIRGRVGSGKPNSIQAARSSKMDNE